MKTHLAILRKTLFERRFSTFLWFVAIVLFVVLTILLFPSLRDSLGESLKDAPKSMEKFLGSAKDYQTITGYVDLQVINQMVFMTVIMGIIVGTSLLAGEERSGVLHTQLARPITRASIYWQKVAALALLTCVVACFGVFVGVLLGALLLGESINAFKLFEASAMTWLITLFFAVLAYAIGAVTGKRGIAGIVAGLYAFVAYMLTALSQLATSLEKLNTFSVFHYFNTPSVIKNGFDTGNVLVLSIAISIILLIGFGVFRKRDLINR
jgi:ABC-2 type transport system permease protein